MKKSRRKSGQSSPLSRPQSLDEISLQEIQDVLLDDGYSVDRRKAWLKELLTDLEQEDSRKASPERAKLIADVKRIIDKQQGAGKPIADDVL
jgi:hypothetical protein